MGRTKRRTPKETYFFSGRTVPEPGTELCKASEMPCPTRIAAHEQMKQLWDFICADMENRRCLSPTYSLLISELVEVTQMLYECRQKISEEGMTIDRFDDEGNFLGSQPSPYVSILSRQQPMLIKLLEKIGMSPRDITFLVNPEATAHSTIQQATNDIKAITYFR